jgi:hypothetical protein
MTLRRTIAALMLVLAFAPTTPAQAHHGYAGPVRLYLDAVSLEPGINGWLIRAALHDSGNGRPAPGFVVNATGTGPQGAPLGPVNLADPERDGRYEAALGQLPTGDWSLTLDVADAPGASERAIPVKRTWPVTLSPNQPLDVLGQLPAPKPGDSSDSGRPVALLLGVAAGVAGLAVAARQLTRRRTRPAAAG